MVAIFVFGIVTIGLIPLIGTSIRSSSLARSLERAKSTAERSMELVRSLPFYTSYGQQSREVDVLDFFYKSSSGGPSAGNDWTYTITCASGSTAIECPDDIPTGYTVTFESQFVESAGIGGDGTETFDAVQPRAGYAWDNAGNDLPRTRLVRMRITASWNFINRTRSYSIVELIGERDALPDRVSGLATVDYGAQVLTGFKRLVDSSKTYLVVDVGRAEARIHSADVSEASQTASGGILRLTRDGGGSGLGSILFDGSGAKSSYFAPPDVDPAMGATATEQTIVHPDIAQTVAFLDDTLTGTPQALRVLTQPLAAGSFRINSQVLSAGDVVHTYVTNQALTGAASSLKLDARPMFSIRPDPAICIDSCNATLTGSTESKATPVGAAGRHVLSEATTTFGPGGEVDLFPVTYIPVTQVARTVIRISDFTASVSCKASPLTGIAMVSATWSAKLRYWDPTKNLGLGGYSSPPTFLHADPDPFIDLKNNNPKVYEGNALTTADDLYLFNVGAQNGYLSSASTLVTPFTQTLEAGRYVAASVDGAIRLDSVPTDPTIPESRLNISIGRVSCESIDRR